MLELYSGGSVAPTGTLATYGVMFTLLLAAAGSPCLCEKIRRSLRAEVRYIWARIANLPREITQKGKGDRDDDPPKVAALIQKPFEGLERMFEQVRHPVCELPVKDLIGKTASNALEQLQVLLHDSRVGKIAIHGTKGIGKTLLMKHLHNRALKCQKFDFVLWVTFNGKFSIKHTQDLLAAAVKCDLSNISDLTVRAMKLSDRFKALGRFVLFVDALTESTFPPEEVGIPVPCEGNQCKLILAINSDSMCEGFDPDETFKLDRLPEEELELFLQEAGVDLASVSSFNSIPSLIVKECHGVPSMIEEVPSRLSSIHDIREWRNTLYELGA